MFHSFPEPHNPYKHVSCSPNSRYVPHFNALKYRLVATTFPNFINLCKLITTNIRTPQTFKIQHIKEAEYFLEASKYRVTCKYIMFTLVSHGVQCTHQNIHSSSIWIYSVTGIVKQNAQCRQAFTTGPTLKGKYITALLIPQALFLFLFPVLN